MSAQRLIPYPEVRAVEDVVWEQQATPTRIFAILFPIWRVEVQATITEGEDYELIDRYLERGIAEGGLYSPRALADFFGLDEVVVDRSLRALTAIGHLADGGGQLALTAIGLRSVRDGVRYVITRQDRRILYFDAFGSRPLSHRYYDKRAVQLLTPTAAAAAAAANEWPRFWSLCSMRGFRPDALAELARNPRRKYFNLPERIDSPELLGAPECEFLPMYVLRAIESDGRVRLFVYTSAGDTADLDLSELCEQTPDVSGLIESDRVSAEHEYAGRARQWLDRRNVADYQLRQLSDGMLRVTVPAASIGKEGAFSLSQIGSFLTLNKDIVHLWCEDVQVRRQALLERVDAYLSRQVRPDQAAVQSFVSRLARQLELGELGRSALQQMAAAGGKPALAAQLEQLQI